MSDSEYAAPPCSAAVPYYGVIYPPEGYYLLRKRQYDKAGDILFRGKFGVDDWVGVMPVNAGCMVRGRVVARKLPNDKAQFLNEVK